MKPMALAAALNGEVEILIFGAGAGDEKDQFVVWLKLHRPKLAKRLVSSAVVDEHQHSEDQLLANARNSPTR
jgi:hypothetical protein